MKTLQTTAFAALIVTTWSVGALAQEQARDFSADSARTHRAPRGEFLTPPSSAPRADIVMNFLRGQGHTDETANSLLLESENFVSRTGITHSRFRQQVAGLDVYGTYVRSSTTGNGQLTSVVENLASITPAPLAPAQITVADALDVVLDEFYSNVTGPFPEIGTTGNTTEFDGGTFFFENPTATRVAVPMANGAMHVGYVVTTWDDQDNLLRHTVVGRTGLILVVETRTSADTYKIFPDNPSSTPTQTVVSGPGVGNLESPEGWLVSNTSTTTTGNNVDAYLDRNADNVADSGGRPFSSTQTFEYDADFDQEPTTSVNQDLAVASLFYFNNVIHDKLYFHGFTESAGNFQENNFGKGGGGSDSVLAEAQDGSGTNNANFATPTDGGNPRMQMYLWTTTSPGRDGDLDSDIIWHEYGHGLTWRMIGNMSGPLAGAIGEGQSDVLAIYINRSTDSQARVAEYPSTDADGIRRYPYNSYPTSMTYGDVTGNSVHSDGEIYAATMWELLNLWEAAGYSEPELWDVMVDGMNNTTPQPAFEDMRDGLIASTSNLEQECLVWEAFAARGIGEFANGSLSRRGPFYRVSITESFAEPSYCSGGNIAPTVMITAPADGSSFDKDTPIQFTGTADDTEDPDLTGSLTWTSDLDGDIGSGGSFSTSTLSVGTHTITASVTDSGGLGGQDSITVTVTSVGGNITLTANVPNGRPRVQLEWTGASGSSVDIIRDGQTIDTTANDGSYQDRNVTGGFEYSYQVCEVGDGPCSNTVTATP